MNKYIVIVLSLLFVNFISAQKLLVDKVDGDGKRFMQTKHQTIYSKLLSGGAISLICIVDETDTTYMIELLLNEGKRQIDVGNVLLLKLYDESVITLRNVKEIGAGDYEIRTTYNGGSEFLSFPIYPVTKDEIIRIIDGDVITIRVETNAEMLDRTIRGRLSEELSEAYDLIERKLKEKKTIYSDF